MAYEQVKQFYPSEMGKEKGWCLKNCRLGYRIYTGHYASAKSAMQAGKKNGTYHDGMPPNNVAVPVYTQTSSPNGHVMVCDKGVWWSDGKKYNSMSGVLGWDEMCDGVRVVQQSSGQGFLPPKGYWGRYDKDARVAELASFMRKVFPAYTPSSALGPIYGDNLWKSMVQFQKNARADGNYNAKIDGDTGPKTYEALKKYGFKG